MLTVTPLPNKILIESLDRGERKIGGIIVRNDNGKSNGVRPRWAKVYAVGSEVKDLKAGDWILIEHGRWTRALNVQLDETPGTNNPTIQLQSVEPCAIMAMSVTEPVDEILGE